ncbi:36104_t:CDS:2, partial [Gigaspora margarita]
PKKSSQIQPEQKGHWNNESELLIHATYNNIYSVAQKLEVVSVDLAVIPSGLTTKGSCEQQKQEILKELYKVIITNNLDTLENSNKKNKSENNNLVISIENSFSTDTTNIDDYISDSDDIVNYFTNEE